FNHGGFYFQDVDGQEPFIVSEFIIIYPKDLPLLFHERNLPVSAVITEDPATGLVTRRYTVERLPLVEREPMMPSRDAIFPMVKIVTPRTWNLVAAAAKDRHLSRTDTTYLVRETTARVLAAPGEGGAPAPRGTAGKLRRLYAWVNAEIESGSNGPTATLIEKRGDREDLFLTMCEAAGIPRKPAFCRAREQFHDDTWWETPNMSYFSDYSCNLFETEEGDIWLTVGPKFAPFGVLPYPLQGGTALVLDDVGGYEFRRLPARPDEEHVVRTATLLKVKPDATVSAQYEIRLAGLQGAGLKESAKDWDNNRKKNFGENALLRHFGAPREVALDFGDLKAFGQPFTFSAEFTMDRFARKNGAEVAVRNGLEPLMLTQRFVDRAQRQFPLYALSPLHREDAVLVQAEPGMTPAAPPPDLVLLTGFGHYSLHFSSGEEGVRIVRRLATDGMRVSPREYPQLIEFCRAIDRAEESRVTFTVR
ncbi:MAG: transglutaminase domain-containing protein, partial [Planctomycetes bacterium]|nr:transglutaminase domain-containing protein [Planctomycetota bacterium]